MVFKYYTLINRDLDFERTLNSGELNFQQILSCGEVGPRKLTL